MSHIRHPPMPSAANNLQWEAVTRPSDASLKAEAPRRGVSEPCLHGKGQLCPKGVSRDCRTAVLPSSPRCGNFAWAGLCSLVGHPFSVKNLFSYKIQGSSDRHASLSVDCSWYHVRQDGKAPFVSLMSRSLKQLFPCPEATRVVCDQGILGPMFNRVVSLPFSDSLAKSLRAI